MPGINSNSPKACLLSKGDVKSCVGHGTGMPADSKSSMAQLPASLFAAGTVGCCSLTWWAPSDLDAHVMFKCHLVAKATTPWALCVILVAPIRHIKNPLNCTAEHTCIFTYRRPPFMFHNNTRSQIDRDR